MNVRRRRTAEEGPQLQRENEHTNDSRDPEHDPEGPSLFLVIHVDAHYADVPNMRRGKFAAMRMTADSPARACIR